MRVGNTFYQSVNGILYSLDGLTLVAYPPGLVGSFTIPEGVTTIAKEAFEYCTGLTNITVSSTLTTIEEQAFRSCQSLESANLQSQVSSIPNYCFADCYKLTDIIFPSGADKHRDLCL